MSSAPEPAEQGADAPDIVLLAPRDGTPAPLTTTAELAQLCQRLAAGTGPVAVDAERASGYRYSQRAYLVQIRRAGAGTALIDPITLPDLESIGAVLRDVEWVLHAANQDLACLAEVGLRPRHLFDTELAGRLAGFERVGLGAIVRQVLGLHLEKGHSAADWSTRPLPREWLTYAALDVEVLIELRDALDASLTAQGKREWAAQEFAALVESTPAPPRIDPWRRTSGIHKLRSRRQLAAVRELWTARDEIARRRDIAPGRILPDAAVIAAASAEPKTPEDLLDIRVFGGRANRRLIGTWFGALQRARALPLEQLPPISLISDSPPPPSRWMDREPQAALRLAAARAALAALSETLLVPVENLLTPELVRRLAWEPPADHSEQSVAAVLAEGGARPWQIELAAGLLSAALDAGESADGR
ncbi:MAG: ribonuclease D [Geodermatophilaceae bacterium]|nr:ribonuclease D [Geodermatophilaceae bacterium]